MKKLFFLSVMLWAGAFFGQQPFAPAGAKWYVDVGGEEGYLLNYQVFEATGDTIVDGKTLRKVGQELVFQDSSKVYFWADNDSSLHLMYDFGVTVGDSVALDFSGGPRFFFASATLVVTQDTQITVSGISLKKIVGKIVPPGPSYPDVTIAYAERIGAIQEESDTFWESPIAIYPYSSTANLPPFLRCYEDGSLAYRSSTFEGLGSNLPCDYRQPLSNEPAANPQIQLHPNPTTGPLTLTLPANARPAEASGKLLDLNGRVVKDFAFAGRNLTLNLSDVPVGLYGLEVYVGENLHVRQKVCVVR
jgi:hypothetical protein